MLQKEILALLQLQRENAQELLATAARLLRSASRRYGTILPEQFNSLLEGRIDESQLTLRPWPAQVHHILGLIQSGVGGEIGRLPGGLRMVAGSLLAKAYVTGDTLQQKQALEVAAVAPDGVFAGITRAAFNGSSEWLRDTAYRQAARLHSLTPDVEGGIRVLLGRMSVDRRLWPERVTVHAQISRLGSTSLNRAFYLSDGAASGLGRKRRGHLVAAHAARDSSVGESRRFGSCGEFRDPPSKNSACTSPRLDLGTPGSRGGDARVGRGMGAAVVHRAARHRLLFGDTGEPEDRLADGGCRSLRTIVGTGRLLRGGACPIASMVLPAGGAARRRCGLV